MDIKRDISTGVFTWTDVVTGVAATRSEYSRGSAATVTYSATEVAWKDGTLTFAQSSANTGTTDVASIYFDSATNGLYAKVNGTAVLLASAANP